MRFGIGHFLPSSSCIALETVTNKMPLMMTQRSVMGQSGTKHQWVRVSVKFWFILHHWKASYLFYHSNLSFLSRLKRKAEMAQQMEVSLLVSVNHEIIVLTTGTNKKLCIMNYLISAFSWHFSQRLYCIWGCRYPAVREDSQGFPIPHYKWKLDWLCSCSHPAQSPDCRQTQCPGVSVPHCPAVSHSNTRIYRVSSKCSKHFKHSFKWLSLCSWF